MQEMDLHLELGQLPWPPEHVPELLDVIVAGHRAVVDAIEERDASRARALTEEHIETRTLWSIELRLQRVGEGATAVRQEVS
jgi:DNA-binding GntR family transcriptional regulator